MDPLSAEIVVFQHPCDPVRHGSRPALGELRSASNARNGMQLDDDDNMQVDSQGAANDDNMQVERWKVKVRPWWRCWAASQV